MAIKRRVLKGNDEYIFDYFTSPNFKELSREVEGLVEWLQGFVLSDECKKDYPEMYKGVEPFGGMTIIHLMVEKDGINLGKEASDKLTWEGIRKLKEKYGG